MKRVATTRSVVAGTLAALVIVIAAASSFAGGSEPARGGGFDGAVSPGGPRGDGSTAGAGGSLGMCAAPTGPIGPETPVCNDIITVPGGDDPVAQIVEPRPGMADVYPRIFDSATVANDDVTVTLDFVSGVEPCYVLDHVDVAYAGATVTITLFEGHDPSAGDVACIEIGVFKRVIVTLDEPLAGRTIVDGAAG